MYESIVTHDDFDGITSAAICSHVFDIDTFRFTGPRSVTESRLTITDDDIVCDLPYPLECGMWFDHHQGNLDELQYRGIDPNDIEGRFSAEPSCCRVVLNYFAERETLPVHFKSMADEADIIDSFNYTSIDDWRAVTPGKIIESTLKLKGSDHKSRDRYMGRLVQALRVQSLDEVSQLSEVQEMYGRFQIEEEQMIQQIEGDSRFLQEDVAREIILLDLTRHNRRPQIVKNLAYLRHRDAKAVLEIRNRFHRGVKTNDLSFSMSLSLNLNDEEHNKDVGEIMRTLNIGDGHAGAGAGTVDCRSKDEMLRQKDEILNQIFIIWSKQ